MPVSLYDLSVIGIVGLAIGVTGFVTIIALGAWAFRDMKRGTDELVRLARTTGALIFQEDERIRALVNARFDEIMRHLPR
jgi:hypothetical protein